MGGTAGIVIETAFNILYLIVVWWLVIAMFMRRGAVAAGERRVAQLVFCAFFLLGLGDIGHVGFRVVAFVLGGLDASVTLFGKPLLLAPMGSLATAVTFTFFYIIMVMLWRERFNGRYGAIGWGLLGIAAVRLLLMASPANDWNSLQPPLAWAIYRNVPLMLMQLGAAGLMLRDAREHGDRTFTWIAVMILVSFVCYAPVVFLQYALPLIGMLMIPKTVAYLVIAFIAYTAFFKKSGMRDAVTAVSYR